MRFNSSSDLRTKNANHHVIVKVVGRLWGNGGIMKAFPGWIGDGYSFLHSAKKASLFYAGKWKAFRVVFLEFRLWNNYVQSIHGRKSDEEILFPSNYANSPMNTEEQQFRAETANAKWFLFYSLDLFLPVSSEEHFFNLKGHPQMWIRKKKLHSRVPKSLLEQMDFPKIPTTRWNPTDFFNR